MNSIHFPLNLNRKRAAINDLHQALTSIGYPIAEGERKDQRYGASTRRAGLKF